MKCSACSRLVPTKEPRCPHCGRWGTIARWRSVADIERRTVERIATGVPELDDVLGGGWVPDCVYRLSGPPGSGKSTVALDLAVRLPSIYAASEESEAAIRMRFDRLLNSGTSRYPLIGAISSVEEVNDVPAEVRLVVVDSLHRLRSPDVAGAAGSNAQLLHAIEGLVALARGRGLIVLAISHVNKDGDASGTTGVDHDADGLLEMSRASEDSDEGTLRVLKNRHGPAPRSIAVRLVETGVEYEEKKEARTKQAAQGRIHRESEEVPA